MPTAGGSTLHLLVLSSTPEDTTVVDLATRTVMRVRVPWPEGHEPDISTFDVVEVTLAEDPERDDLAQPEATTVADLPRHVGTLRGRHLRKLLRRLVASPDGPLLGFPGPSAPYWEFRGFRPSVALIEPTRRPQLIRRQADGSTWVRFGWDRDDVWLPVEDRNAARALDAARRERLSGKSLATALGFEPQYLLVTVSPLAMATVTRCVRRCCPAAEFDIGATARPRRPTAYPPTVSPPQSATHIDDLVEVDNHRARGPTRNGS